MPQIDSNNIEHETWLPYVFEGINPAFKYQVSSKGRVKVFQVKSKEWRIQKTSNQHKDGSGYEYFKFATLTVDGNTKKITKAMHRIVAELFCENQTKSANTVLHLDHNKANNDHKNLSWATKKGQLKHRKTNPTIKNAYTKLEGLARNSKLNEAKVAQLLIDVEKGEKPYYRIAFDYGISQTQLNRIRNGTCWPNVKRK